MNMDGSVYAFWKIINYVQQFKFFIGGGGGLHKYNLECHRDRDLFFLSLHREYNNVFISDVWVLDLHFEFILS